MNMGLGSPKNPLAPITIERFYGLEPSAWLCVGSGYSREEVKDLLLKSGHAVTGSTVITISQLALKIIQSSGSKITADRILTATARQEALRVLLADRRILSQVPELRRLRRQSSFFRRLDQAIQAGRLTFAHSEEEAVHHSFLAHRFGPNDLRQELRGMVLAYEAWLSEKEWVDLPALLRLACEILGAAASEVAFNLPDEIFMISVRDGESLENLFWERLSEHTQITRVDVREAAFYDSPPKTHWELWHTTDDAADALAETLAESPDWSREVVLIPDDASVRRSLKRALSQMQIPIADPRDPNRLRFDEGLKWALLPLQCVGRNYERIWVNSLILSGMGIRGEAASKAEWIAEISSRGIRDGLNSYSGGRLSLLHPQLVEIARRLGGKRSCQSIGRAHLEFLRGAILERTELSWVYRFFEGFWSEFESDLKRTDQEDRCAQVLYWIERIESRIEDSRAPVDKTRSESGIQVYRYQQAVLQSTDRVWCLGLSNHWLSSEPAGDYWYSERDREALGTEFAIRSSVHARKERLRALECWLKSSKDFHILSSRYDEDGSEREDLQPLLEELTRLSHIVFPTQPKEYGSHDRWKKSFGALRPVPSFKVQLAPGSKNITATVLDKYSRCEFQGLVFSRWKLWDQREPDTELWPEVRGNILHEAVRLMLKEKAPPQSALDQAWVSKPPRGLMRGKKIEKYVKSRLLNILLTFAAKEVEFVKKAGTQTISLENCSFEYTVGDIVVRGTPDRIDEHPEGLFVIDYKTSTDLPNGREMLEKNYRLQLPFYALATRRQMNKPVVGAQLVELTRRGARNAGIFFTRFNGKEPGKLTQFRSNLRSLMTEEPDEIWSQFEVKVSDAARGFVAGRFEVRPRRGEAECRSCAAADLCGIRRALDATETGEAIE